MTANPERGATPRRRHAPHRRGRSGLARWAGIPVLALAALVVGGCAQDSASTWTHAPLARASTPVPEQAAATDRGTSDAAADQSATERAIPLQPPAGNVIPRFVEPERAEGPDAGDVDAAPLAIEPGLASADEATPAPATRPAAATSPSTTTEPSDPAAEPTEDAAVSELTIVAQDTAFDPEELAVEAGASVRLTLENHDPIPHSFAVYRTDAAEEAVFVGETFSGPDASRTYEFTAPAEPGEYLFRCDIHPQLMTGTLIVE